jgi:hypothetical protein
MGGRYGRTIALAAALGLVTTACAWGQVGGNAGRNSANPFETVLTPDNVGDVAPRWRADNATQAGNQPVMDARYVFTAGLGSLNAYAIDGPASPAGASRCSGTPVVCAPVWSASIPTVSVSSPAVSGDTVFAGAAIEGQWVLYAFAAGATSCPGGCLPKWTATFATADDEPRTTASIAVDGGRVFVATPPVTDSDLGHVTAFDERGVTGCSAGPPRRCSPLFSVETTVSFAAAPVIAVASGRLFVESVDATSVFDAAGVQGCSAGACAPLYRLATGSAAGVVVSGTTGYAVIGRTQLAAFDATGAVGCTGSPRTCAPRWTAPLAAPQRGHEIAVSNGKVVVAEAGDPPNGLALEAFDAAGQQGCGGAPVVCTARWSATRAAVPGDVLRLAATPTLLFVGGWTVIPSNPVILRQHLTAFDVAGTRNCSGAPVRCTSLSTDEFGTDHGFDGLAVAFGRVAMTDTLGHLKVFALA